MPPFRLRTLLLSLVAVIGVGLVPFLVPLLLSQDRLSAAVKQALQRNRSIAATFDGPVSLSFAPLPRLTLGAVRLQAQPSGAVLAEAAGVEANLALLPLFRGQADVASLRFQRPTILIASDADGRSNWDGVLAEFVSAASRAGTNPHIGFDDGIVQMRHARSGVDLAVQAVSLDLVWPSLQSGLSVSGSLSNRGGIFSYRMTLADPAKLVEGGDSAVTWRGSMRDLSTSFDGKVMSAGRLQAVGRFSADTGSLRAVLRWLGHDPGPGEALAAFAIKGDASILPDQMTVRDANVQLDGNSATGAVTLKQDGAKLAVSGTLDAGSLVLTPYFSDLVLMPSAGQQWNRKPVDMRLLTSADLDIRVSAREAVIGGVQLGRSAASITSRGGKLTVTLGEANAYGGVLRGSLTLAPVANGATAVQGVLAAQRVDLGKGFGDWFGFRRLEGTGNVQLMIDARGSNVETFARSAQGEASLVAIDGAISGVNAEAILRRLERRPLAAGYAEARSGKTPFTRAAVSVKLADGVARTEDMVLDGPLVQVALAGSAALGSRELDLKGIASLKRSAAPKPKDDDRFDLPFLVQGPWSDPYVLPDPDALIRRSGAAAPLLDKTRDRDAVRAVMDAIKQHTGSDGEIRLDSLPNTLGPIPPLILPPGEFQR